MKSIKIAVATLSKMISNSSVATEHFLHKTSPMSGKHEYQPQYSSIKSGLYAARSFHIDYLR